MSEAFIRKMLDAYPGADLGDLVLEEGTRRIAEVNRAGLGRQIELLLQLGLNEAKIRRMLATTSDGRREEESDPRLSRYPQVGVNADWQGPAWFLGPGTANRTPGARYLLSEEEGNWEVVRRWYVENGYAGIPAEYRDDIDGHSDVIVTVGQYGSLSEALDALDAQPEDPDWTVPSVLKGKVDALPGKRPEAPTPQPNRRNTVPNGNRTQRPHAAPHGVPAQRRHADPPPERGSLHDPAAILARYRT